MLIVGQSSFKIRISLPTLKFWSLINPSQIVFHICCSDLAQSQQKFGIISKYEVLPKMDLSKNIADEIYANSHIFFTENDFPRDLANCFDIEN